MKCHYEVLDIATDATDDEIKKAYYKLALKWHPDKNCDNVELAKKNFQIIQQAYSVLNDPQERAFYDKHRDNIIRGTGSNYQENKLNVFHYFNTGCYKGYGDDKTGFYTVYRNVFKKIGQEESEFSSETLPEFGYSDSGYDIVQAFYSCWLFFCTKKVYSWKDMYDVRNADNRRIARLMEQENKRNREKFRKDRNEEVRGLVAFVRKRDTRVQNYASYLKQKNEENIKKTEENRRKMIEKHKEDIASYKECDLLKYSDYEKELKQIESTIAAEFNDLSDNSSEDYNDLYCIACDKYFKTEKAFSNHEKSKKHKENVSIIKTDIAEEDTIIKSASENNHEKYSDETSATVTNDDSESEKGVKFKIKNKKTEAAKTLLSTGEGSSSDSCKEDTNSYCVSCDKYFKTVVAFESHLKSKKHRSNVIANKNYLAKEEEYSSSESENITEKATVNNKIKTGSEEFINKKKKRNHQNKNLIPDKNIDATSHHNETSTSELLDKIDSPHCRRSKMQQDSQNNLNDIANDLQHLNVSKRQRKKQEREKLKLKSGVKENSDDSDTNIGQLQNNIVSKSRDLTGSLPKKAEEHSLVCVVCNCMFKSKNKLFGHLKTTGHAVPITAVNERAKSSRKKKR